MQLVVKLRDFVGDPFFTLLQRVANSSFTNALRGNAFFLNFHFVVAKCHESVEVRYDFKLVIL